MKEYQTATKNIAEYKTILGEEHSLEKALIINSVCNKMTSEEYIEFTIKELESITSTTERVCAGHILSFVLGLELINSEEYKLIAQDLMEFLEEFWSLLKLLFCIVLIILFAVISHCIIRLIQIVVLIITVAEYVVYCFGFLQIYKLYPNRTMLISMAAALVLALFLATQFNDSVQSIIVIYKIGVRTLRLRKHMCLGFMYSIMKRNTYNL